MKTAIRSGAHSVHLLHAHLVFVTKYRRKVLTNKILTDMRSLFERLCQKHETDLVEFDGEEDHVHLLINYPPKLSLSKLIHQLKGSSSFQLRRMYPAHINQYYWKGVLWSPSYFAGSCGGAPIEIVRQYIEQQNTPH